MATNISIQTMNNSGSNANGNYCKMPDGTLIQWGRLTSNVPAGKVTVNFPISFIESPFVTLDTTNAFNTETSVQYGLGVTSISTSNFSFRFTWTGATTTDIVTWFAIGRWK